MSSKAIVKLMKELSKLEKEPLDGISVTYQDDDIQKIFATIQGPCMHHKLRSKRVVSISQIWFAGWGAVANTPFEGASSR